MTDYPQATGLAALFQNKLLTALLALALVLGIAVEGVQLYQGWQNIQINNNKISTSTAEAATANTRTVQFHIYGDSTSTANGDTQPVTETFLQRLQRIQKMRDAQDTEIVAKRGILCYDTNPLYRTLTLPQFLAMTDEQIAAENAKCKTP